MNNKNYIIIDAGVEHIHIKIFENSTEKTLLIKNNNEIITLFKENNFYEKLNNSDFDLFITGKLAEIIKKSLNRGEIIMPSAAIWSQADYLSKKSNFKANLGIIDLSASGYMIIAIDKNGELINDLLLTNPRCGAGSGINLSRILEKLDIRKNEVDAILKDYLGNQGEKKRRETAIRADRCGVFSSSATISDKNQGIPLDFALAVTMKSEVLKVCKKMPEKVINTVYLTGRVFEWQYMRDCAQDYLSDIGVKKIIFDDKQTILINGVENLIKKIGKDKFRKQEKHKLKKEEKMIEYPSFGYLKNKYQNEGLFERIPDPAITNVIKTDLNKLPVKIGLDVGSTMTKMVIADAQTNDISYLSSYDNHGDTIETIKHIFKKLKKEGVAQLNIQSVGITGSGRYQVKKVLQKIYPSIKDRIFDLVENYAHARGSIQLVKEHIDKLEKNGEKVNTDFCALVDIGGEDTKVSIISLAKEELFDNAMNIKCSAGTGSLMDTLKALFGIKEISDACRRAFQAPKAYEINATCAVFLMENAKKMQSLGYDKDEILASCNYAIVENMARTLWNQVDIPKNGIVLLHGQTMLSDPLPLAVTHRLQEESKTYALVPPMPGHRACLGLIKSAENYEINDNFCKLDDFINIKFDKKIIICRGAACGDPNASCSRTFLNSTNSNEALSLLLGGCSAINEINIKNKIEPAENTYRQIWQFLDSKLPRSENSKRLIIPRAFTVSAEAYFISQIFLKLGIPTHVDNVREEDIMAGQPLFEIDVCAPLIGATGHFIRLGGEQHGIILAPQIDFLPTGKKSLGRTCTTNQGGIAIAKNLAEAKHPEANFFLFDLSIKKFDADYLSNQLYDKFLKIFDFYNLKISVDDFKKAINFAIENNKKQKKQLAELIYKILEKSINKKQNITIVCGREYLLNPEIYDSHVGKLLKDKGITAIPSYALETELDDDFGYLYWRNAHDIVGKINAIANKNLYKYLKDKNLQKLFKKIETGQTDTLISAVQVSTFRCGPDTMISPVISEILKKTPSLLIQSDAMIKELAHLENRINTFINQLNKKLHEEFDSKKFEIKLIKQFESSELNAETDVIYFPTMHDNRMITSVFKAAGVTIIDNYDDETYNLEQKVKFGRRFTGDSVCAPMAGVFADIVLAENDFIKRKKAGDPLVEGKTRVLIFDNKGQGPCRQGQYLEVHKLLLSKQSACHGCNSNPGHQVKLILAGEEGGYNFGMDEWTFILSFQGTILHGLLHSILLKGGASCRNYDEYQNFIGDYSRFKNKIYECIAKQKKPSDKIFAMLKKIEKKSELSAIMAKYFIYGIYNNNGLRKIIKKFSKKWLNRPEKAESLKIHIEGEAYIRAAQIQDIFNSLIDTLGFNSIKVNYTPVWSFFELLLELEIIKSNEEIRCQQNELKNKSRNNLEKGAELLIKKERDKIKKVKKIRNALRNILAKPLYKAANIEMPHKMSHVLEKTKKILPTLKPIGELPPYIGEAILKIEEGVDLFLNLAPEGCMVSSMSQMFSKPILSSAPNHSRIQDLFTLNGEVNEEQLSMSLLKTLGPIKFYTQK